MQGTLFKYGCTAAHVAFKSAPPRTSGSTTTHQPGGIGGSGECRRHLVLVGGLTDGLLFAPYAQQLAAAVAELGWRLVQASLTSSEAGWGLASLDQDAADIRLLADCLAREHGCHAWVLMGHSTGCQDAVRYVTRHKAEDTRLAGVILQAPVSDREYLSTLPAWQGSVAAAQQLVQDGRGEEVVLRAADWDGAPVCARRLVSLCCDGGDDDMFSTDLPLDQLRAILGPLQDCPTLILQSGADETVPAALRESGAVAALGQRMLQALQLGPAHPQQQDGNSAAVATKHHALRVLEGAGHACAGHEATLVREVRAWLADLVVPDAAATAT